MVLQLHLLTTERWFYNSTCPPRKGWFYNSTCSWSQLYAFTYWQPQHLNTIHTVGTGTLVQLLARPTRGSVYNIDRIWHNDYITAHHNCSHNDNYYNPNMRKLTAVVGRKLPREQILTIKVQESSIKRANSQRQKNKLLTTLHHESVDWGTWPQCVIHCHVSRSLNIETPLPCLHIIDWPLALKTHDSGANVISSTTTTARFPPA